MARRYLDPRNDIVFKRIFGEHPEILRSFLNAVLPLPPDGQILSLEYLSGEQVPQLPLLKNTIVDVRCRDQRGRQFIVEMQMNWTKAFLRRVLFNASKAYVRQLDRGERFELLQPVIGLSVLDAVFRPESEGYYHHYQIAEEGCPESVIEGLQLVFIELPKFKPAQMDEGPLKTAWLRFLQETGDADSPAEAKQLQEQVGAVAPEIQEALNLAEEAAFTPGELEAYDRYWDAVSRERTLLESATSDAWLRGLAAGQAEGLAKGHAAGLSEGREAERAALLAKLLASGMSEEQARRLLD